MSNTTTTPHPKCSPLPDDLPIPKGINYAATEGRNGSEPWMVTCCAPKPVSFVGGCFVWCELPGSQIATYPDGSKHTDFVKCLRRNGWGDEQGSVVYKLDATAASRGGRTGRVTMRGVGVWLVGVAGVVGWGL